MRLTKTMMNNAMQQSTINTQKETLKRSRMLYKLKDKTRPRARTRSQKQECRNSSANLRAAMHR